ncbi:hypothetical protein ABZ915_17710 [Streptomyces sp. NPDC046915]|uniref:hypothetical protein n=1 Tax=Streptomyces sp. NPDC046915 TaxID=3155257 RepID=UPI0033ED7CF7
MVKKPTFLHNVVFAQVRALSIAPQRPADRVAAAAHDLHVLQALRWPPQMVTSQRIGRGDGPLTVNPAIGAPRLRLNGLSDERLPRRAIAALRRHPTPLIPTIVDGKATLRAATTSRETTAVQAGASCHGYLQVLGYRLLLHHWCPQSTSAGL